MSVSQIRVYEFLNFSKIKNLSLKLFSNFVKKKLNRNWAKRNSPKWRSRLKT